jgi:hypothetical protein
MPNSGIEQAIAPLLTPEAARTAMRVAARRREQFAAKHPEVKFTARRDGSRLLFEVSEPTRASWATHDPVAMMDDLEARYPE